MSSPITPPVLNPADFAAILKSLQEEDDRREQLIKRSRDVLKNSKQAIYALQRGAVAEANSLIETGKQLARELLLVLEPYPHLRHGALSSALEEWAEAAIFACYLRENRIATMAELEICNRDEYLGGVMDFCGEINRFAVLAATKRDVAVVSRAREVIDALLAQLMLFDFRNGALRRTYGACAVRISQHPLASPFPPASTPRHTASSTDGVKYTLNKLEQICYDLSLSSTGYLPKGGAREATAPPASSEEAGGEEVTEGAGDAEGTGKRARR
jgi:hypothetical protein